MGKKAKKGNFRAFQITSDNRNLIWYSGKKTLESTTVPLSEVIQIVSGNKHDSFKGKPAEVKNCSFVVEYTGKDGKKKELTISAKTEFESLMWQQGLSILADHNKGLGFDVKKLKQIAFKAPARARTGLLTAEDPARPNRLPEVALPAATRSATMFPKRTRDKRRKTVCSRSVRNK